VGHVSDRASDALEPALRVALADDSFFVRQALEHVLADEEGIDVVAACRDGAELQQALAAGEVDVVVTDIRMPPSETDEGLRLAAELSVARPDVGVVVLSQYAEPQYGLALLANGPEGRAYLLKEHVHRGSQLVAAIRTVAEGGSMIDAQVVQRLIATRRGDEDSTLAALTPRELETLSYVARGFSNQGIADELYLSKRAIEKHVNAIFLKLKLTDAMDASVSRRVKAALMYLAEHGEG
jgi:DNA-binding NarL/FixJ family response regulator